MRPSPDAEFRRVADEYLAGYLAWRPATGMVLGLHEYDGRITDFSRASLDAELRRLKEFDRQLARLSTKKLTREAARVDWSGDAHRVGQHQACSIGRRCSQHQACQGPHLGFCIDDGAFSQIAGGISGERQSEQCGPSPRMPLSES